MLYYIKIVNDEYQYDKAMFNGLSNWYKNKRVFMAKKHNCDYRIKSIKVVVLFTEMQRRVSWVSVKFPSSA